MVKIYVNTSKTGVAEWAAFEAEKLGGYTYYEIKQDYQSQINVLERKVRDLEAMVLNFLRKDRDDTVTARVKFDDLTGRLVLPVGSNKYATT